MSISCVSTINSVSSDDSLFSDDARSVDIVCGCIISLVKGLSFHINNVGGSVSRGVSSGLIVSVSVGVYIEEGSGWVCNL